MPKPLKDTAGKKRKKSNWEIYLADKDIPIGDRLLVPASMVKWVHMALNGISKDETKSIRSVLDEIVDEIVIKIKRSK